MTKNIFIAGTDTGVGKTYVSVSLLNQCKEAGLSTCAIKPIACGGIYTDAGVFMNEDVLRLQRAATIMQSYESINPFFFKEPIAPNIAASKSGMNLSAAIVQEKIGDRMVSGADINIIEGVGGWSVPLNKQSLFSDVIVALNIPVVLVVGIKLGCLNHAILTSQSIKNSYVPFAGWVANCIDPTMLMLHDNINILNSWIPAPCLGIVPFEEHSVESKVLLTIDALFA